MGDNIEHGHPFWVVMMNDAHLIAAHLSGDSRAMGLLIDRHHAPLMQFLWTRVGRDAEDLQQEIWSRVSRALPKYKERGTFRAWLFQIARRQVVDHHRRSQSRIRVLFGSVPDRPALASPHDELAARQLSDAIHVALEALSPEVAIVVSLRLTQDITFKEIAEQQNIPLNTALGRMHRGLRQIRSRLEQDGLLTPNIIRRG